MGRFTSVQAYADNNANLRKLTYEQATGVPESKADGDGGAVAAAAGSDGGGPPPLLRGDVKTEKVINPYGSTAGAGSGEFHVYRHARAREMARWKQLDNEQQEELLEAEFRATQERNKRQSDERSDKRRKKRQREKEAKERKKHLKAAGIGLSHPTTDRDDDDNGNDDHQEGQEFVYVPQRSAISKTVEETGGEGPGNGTSMEGKDMEIPTDGSFLEVMKRRLEGVGPNSSALPHSTQDDTSGAKRSHDDDDSDDDDGPMLPPATTTQAGANNPDATNSVEAQDPAVTSHTKKARIVETKIFDEEF